jgi:hypothetical protein
VRASRDAKAERPSSKQSSKENDASQRLIVFSLGDATNFDHPLSRTPHRQLLYGREGDSAHTAITNYFGCGMGLCSANAIMTARDGGCPTKTKKDMLKV